MKENSIVFAGGGTGGHIYPGLAVAEEVKRIARERGGKVYICWMGSNRGMDREIVEKACGEDGKRIVDEFVPIRAGKLRRYFSWANVADAFRVVGGFFDSIKYLRRVRPVLLFSKGGFVSVPPVAAARLLHIKVFTHECDLTPGLATRLNAASADSILVSYNETVQYLLPKYCGKAVLTGNPVRSAFYSADAKRGMDILNIVPTYSWGVMKSEKPIVLFLGGSSGARQINTLVQDNLAWLCERFIVVHQTGASTADNSNACYHPFGFIHSGMSDVMAAADIVVSRAGANSIWECAVLSRPMVLIPLCGEGTRGDQVDNAKYFAEIGAAKVLLDANSQELRKVLDELTDENKRKEMSSNCHKVVGEERPAIKIAKMIMDGLGGAK